MEGIRRLLIGVLAAAALAPAVTVQASSWNRKALGVAILPTAEPGVHEIIFYFTVTATDPDAQLDLSTEAEISVNGDVVESTVLNATAYPSMDADCADLPCIGMPCYCLDEPGTCQCGPLRSRITVTVDLSPGDVVAAGVLAAAGAMPEGYTGDDVQSITFDGAPVFWERIVENVGISPGSGEGTYDIGFDATFQVNFDGFLDLSTDALVDINGSTVGGAAIGLNDQDFFFCAGNCFICWAFGVCEAGDDGCLCNGTIGITVHDLQANPGDEVTVRLVTPLGSLPPLNGYGDQDEVTATICPWDCGNQDGAVGIVDFLALLGQWGRTGTACDLGAGGEGVGVEEFLQLLGNWGPCP